MNTLITEVLEYSKLNINEIVETEPIDLNKVLSDNIQLLNSILKEKNAIVISQPLPVIKANRLLVELLFQNIIENGIKYNQNEQPKVEIKVKQVENFMQLAFEDNGEGIEKEYKDRVFDMFTRLSVSEEGTGMGLAICKKIMQRMNGDIWLESERHKGSTFFIKIPIV
jgi:signal transduction histidine kinase